MTTNQLEGLAQTHLAFIEQMCLLVIRYVSVQSKTNQGRTSSTQIPSDTLDM